MGSFAFTGLGGWVIGWRFLVALDVVFLVVGARTFCGGRDWMVLFARGVIGAGTVFCWLWVWWFFGGRGLCGAWYSLCGLLLVLAVGWCGGEIG